MSSILKSLRKIEEEKRADKHVAPNLMVDQGLASVESKQFLPLLTGIALGAVIVGLIFLWAKKDSEPVVKAQPATEPKQIMAVERNSVDSASSVSASPTSILSDKSLKSLAEASKVSVVTLSPEPVIITESINKVVPKPLSKPPVKQRKPAEISTPVSKPAATMQTSQKVAVVKTTLTEHSVLPKGVSLMVDEIFYQDDADNSMAVVNDLPVMIGSHIDSAVVTEIRPDSVLFKIDDKSYVVTVSNP